MKNWSESIEEFRAGEMAQQLKALTILAEDLDSVLRTYLVAHNYLELQIKGILCLFLPLCTSAHMS